MSPTNKTNKRCTVCKEVLPISLFHRDSSKHDGYHQRCKVCFRKYKKNWQSNNTTAAQRLGYRKNSPAYSTKYARLLAQLILGFYKQPTKKESKNKRYINHIKINGKCKMCGHKKPWSLQFHHRNPAEKEGLVSDLAGKNFSTVKAELDKCDILCANCHTELHYIQQKKLA